jgi:hypothetical protein
MNEEIPPSKQNEAQNKEMARLLGAKTGFDILENGE